MSDIFISHSHSDEVFARLLATDLVRMGASIWIDVEDIYPSQYWSQEIQKGLETCDVLLCVISSDAFHSEQVEREWQEFIRLGKPIIPILWRDSRTSLPSELATIEYVDFENQNYHAARHRLKLALEKLGIILGSESRHRLGRRDEFVPIPELAKNASEISVISVSSINLATQHDAFIRQKISAGCNINLILLNPDNSQALENWALVSNRPITQTPRHLQETLEMVDHVNKIPGGRGKCQVRFLDFFFPYNLFGVNIKEDDGVMLIGYYAYSEAGTDHRPHLMLSKRHNTFWFNFYVDQFDKAWKIATRRKK